PWAGSRAPAPAPRIGRDARPGGASVRAGSAARWPPRWTPAAEPADASTAERPEPSDAAQAWAPLAARQAAAWTPWGAAWTRRCAPAAKTQRRAGCAPARKPAVAAAQARAAAGLRRHGPEAATAGGRPERPAPRWPSAGPCT